MKLLFAGLLIIASTTGCSHFDRKRDEHVTINLTADVTPDAKDPTSQALAVHLRREDRSELSEGEFHLEFPPLVINSREVDSKSALVEVDDKGRLIFTTNRHPEPKDVRPTVEFFNFTTNGVAGLKYIIHWKDDVRRNVYEVTIKGSILPPPSK